MGDIVTDAELVTKLDAMAKHIFGLDSGSGDAAVIQQAAMRIRQFHSQMYMANIRKTSSSQHYDGQGYLIIREEDTGL